MKLPFSGPKWTATAEVIEDRQGGEYTWFTKAREIFVRPGNVMEYEVKGFKNKIKAPKYKHMSRTKKGDFLRIYVPSEGEAFIMRLDKGADGDATLTPVYGEGDKEWQDHQIKKSHEDWTKKSFADKWLVFMMVIVVATIFIIGTYLNTEGQVKIAQASQGTASQVASMGGSLQQIDARWSKLIDRIDVLLQKNGIPYDYNGTLIVPPA